MTFVRFKGPVACLVHATIAVSMAMVWTAPAEAQLTHLWTFNDGTANDSEGSANGTIMGGVDFTPFGGKAEFNGDDGFITLPAASINLHEYTEATIEMWWTHNDGSDWQRVIDFGNMDDGGSGNSYLFYSPTAGGGGTRVAIRGPEPGEAGGTVDELSIGVEHHAAVVLDSTSITLYHNGNMVATDTLEAGQMLSDLSQGEGETNYFFGDSNWVGDPFFDGTMNEIRIHSNAFSDTDVENSFQAGTDGPVGPVFVVDRDAGTITFETDEDVNNMVGYSIISDAGALENDNWTTISDNYDASDGGTFDDEGDWSVLSQPDSETDFTEFDFDGTDGGDLAMGNSLQLGDNDAWVRNPIEDLEAEIILNDGTRYTTPVSYVGNGGNPFDPLDLSLSDGVGIEDWEIFRDNHLRDFFDEGLSGVQAALLGDVTGDGDSDFNDFVEFRDGFTAAAGAGSFAEALQVAGGAAVPEPSTAIMMVLACSALSLLRGRGRMGG